MEVKYKIVEIVDFEIDDVYCVYLEVKAFKDFYIDNAIYLFDTFDEALNSLNKHGNQDTEYSIITVIK